MNDGNVATSATDADDCWSPSPNFAAGRGVALLETSWRTLPGEHAGDDIRVFPLMIAHPKLRSVTGAWVAPLAII